jgi:hypothetical protein
MNDPRTNDAEPKTDAMPAFVDGATTAGAAATLHLHHLHGLLTALGPIRLQYASAAVDRLRGLPPEACAAILPHLLAEHPALAYEARVRALAEEVRVDTDAASDRPDVIRWLADISGVPAASASDALARVATTLEALATALSHTIAEHRDVVRRAVGDDSLAPVTSNAGELLTALLLSEDARTADREAITRATTDVARTTELLVRAARVAAAELLASGAPARVEAEARVPTWWPRPFRDAALWAAHVRTHDSVRDPRAFDRALSRAFVALAGQRG